jgi:AhpD family alkylhydroperoxidase
MRNNYPEYYDHIHDWMGKLGKQIPGTLGGFAQLHRASTADGALSAKVKELIALSIAITMRCDGCIAYHIHDTLQVGATHSEIVEAIGIAVMMGGEPSTVYGSEALEALEQFEAAKIREKEHQRT